MSTFPTRISEDFPFLKLGVTYLDSAATSQKPRPVLKAMAEYQQEYCSNVHRGAYALSARATDAYEGAREKVARFIGASKPESCVFTSGTTDAVNLVASTWGEEHIAPGDIILLAASEHHSNLIPWQELATRKDARLHWIEVNDDGTFNEASLTRGLVEKPKLIALSWVSNVFGTIHRLREIAERAPESTIFIDAAQAVPHLACDVEELGCHFLAFSGHKMLGPTGIGVLWGQPQVLSAMRPYRFGGSMIASVTRDKTTYAGIPQRFEAGTPNIAGAIGLGAAVDYLSGVGMGAIREHELDLLRHAAVKLQHIPGLELLGPLDERQSGVLSMRHASVHPHDLATLLDDQGICVRAGHHCCQPLMRQMGISGTVRASFYLYNTRHDVDRLAAGLEKALKVFDRPLRVPV